MSVEITVSKTFTFEASHILPHHPGKCAQLHGHSWTLVVGVKGLVHKGTGFVVDFYDVSRVVKEHVVDKLDHSHLGAGVADYCSGLRSKRFYPYLGPNFYPTSENLTIAIAHILKPLIKELHQDVRLHTVQINETCTSSATWCADDEPFGDQGQPKHPSTRVPAPRGLGDLGLD